MRLLPSLLSCHHSHFPLPKTPPSFTPSPSSKLKFITMSTNISTSKSTPHHHHHHHHQQQQEEEQQQQQLIDEVLAYHNQTKHHLTRYARGPRGLDWANQPNPFRRYINSPLLPLQHNPLHSSSAALDYSSVFRLSNPTPPEPLSLASLSQFLFDSLALSAWKSTGISTWSLRINPSSGNLHPTEAHLFLPPLPNLSPHHPFSAHYAPRHHSLELRSQLSPASSSLLRHFPPNSFLLALTSIFWRESWKYGERALRYCNHDAGHALAALAFSAAALGWDLRLLQSPSTDDLRHALGLPSSSDLESEHPDCLVLVFPSGSAADGLSLDYPAIRDGLAEFASAEWIGTPNSLSKDHVRWDIIYRTAEAVSKPPTLEIGLPVKPLCPSFSPFADGAYRDASLREVIRKRRSAVDMDGVYVMDRNTFYQILLHCLPSGAARERGDKQGKQLTLPFRVMPWEAELHLALFVHRVKDLAKGLYFLVRNEWHFQNLKRAMRSKFEWEKPQGCPDELPLYRLATGDCQKLAKQLSCHQDIASHGCFSLGMIARVEPTLREKNVWMYPRLFWESGVIGQLLYLEAHAVGISATGIGCYFDDAVHEVLGLTDSEFQSLYHFTVGSPVLDKRIMSLPAYPGPGIDA